jgi:hypothetical protein
MFPSIFEFPKTNRSITKPITSYSFLLDSKKSVQNRITQTEKSKSPSPNTHFYAHKILFAIVTDLRQQQKCNPNAGIKSPKTETIDEPCIKMDFSVKSKK